MVIIFWIFYLFQIHKAAEVNVEFPREVQKFDFIDKMSIIYLSEAGEIIRFIDNFSCTLFDEENNNYFLPQDDTGKPDNIEEEKSDAPESIGRNKINNKSKKMGKRKIVSFSNDTKKGNSNQCILS